MGVIQTTAVNCKSLLLGSAKIEASFDSGNTFQNLGLTESASVTVTQTPLDQKPANGTKCSVMEGIAEETGAASFALFELELETLTKLNGNVGKYTAVAGTPVVGATQTLSSGAWEYDKPVEFSVISTVEPTVTAITGSVDGALSTTKGTDYDIVKLSTYRWGIYIIDSVTVTTEVQDIDITFNYTPVESEVMTSGGGTNQDNIALRFTNKTEYKADAAVAAQLSIAAGAAYHQVTEITMHKGVQTSGFGLEFKDKDATDPAIAPLFEFTFENDITKPIQERLYKVERYNAVLS